MIVSIKDIFKLTGIFIVSCCAVFVCTLFLNFNMDIVAVKEQITAEPVMLFYNAQVMTGKVVSAVSGGCLLITSVIMLIFYIKHYIDVHGKELGILKALGYSNLKIAGGFWVFGLSVFLGTAAGFAGSFLLMPGFYRMQNEEKILPEYGISFHPVLAFYLVILPTVLFALLAVSYSYWKLKLPVLALLKGEVQKGSRRERGRGKAAGKASSRYNGGSRKENGRESGIQTADSRQLQTEPYQPFLTELRKSTVRQRAVLVFFTAFASFCFSAMMQMSFSMKELASIMCAVMVVAIGIILACVTLFLAVTTVIRANTKTIAMLRVFGYSRKECSRSILGGYRPIAYIGFGIGTIYQYALLKIMVSVVFRDIENVPEYNFDVQAFLITLAAFAAVYELVMHCYTIRMGKLSLKEIMLE